MIDPLFLLGGALLLTGIALIAVGRVLKLAGTVLIAAVVLVVLGGALGLWSLQDLQDRAANVTANLTIPTAPPDLQPGFEWSCALKNESNPAGGFACSVVPAGGGRT